MVLLAYEDVGFYLVTFLVQVCFNLFSRLTKLTENDNLRLRTSFRISKEILQNLCKFAQFWVILCLAGFFQMLPKVFKTFLFFQVSDELDVLFALDVEVEIVGHVLCKAVVAVRCEQLFGMTEGV